MNMNGFLFIGLIAFVVFLGRKCDMDMQGKDFWGRSKP